jgi:superfamily I DNA/RNA helicase
VDDNFLTRLVIEDLINVGVARVPGANKRMLKSEKSKRKRIAAETEISHLWESVNKKKSLFGVVREKQNSAGIVAIIKDGLNGLLSAYNDCGDAGEFAKSLSYVSGIWTEPLKIADDISRVMDLVDSPKRTVTGTVLLRTMRKAKGLESSVVVVVGLEDDVVPNPRGDICEEARLFYVSLTRAREKLYLIHSYRRTRSVSYSDELMKNQRSRFLDALGIESKYIP